MQLKKHFRITAIIVGVLLALSLLIVACAKTADEGGDAGSEAGNFQLIDDSRAALIVVEGTNAPGATDGDYPGVVRAAYDLQEDIETVTDVKPVIAQSVTGYTDYAIIIGTIGKSEAIDKMIESGKIDVSQVEGKWETYLLETVDDPFGDGKVGTALVIAGSDKRGSIYGIYNISEQLGVSPWTFFADSVPAHRDNFTLAADYRYVSEEPDVQYRGIFINDEEDLELWGRVMDDGKHMGPELYKEIFEMLLRSKANYLWPAMHACSDAFVDYVENPVNADYYGIVIGTSHCDMLLRNNLNEWDNFVSKYKSEHPEYANVKVLYDYTDKASQPVIEEYWRESVRANKDYEVSWTLGMRGAHDEGFNTAYINQAPWYGDKNMLLEQIIDLQRTILMEELGVDTLEDVFMVFQPYKEVQELYNNGLEVPEDITIIWADDNHGFVRNVPNAEERERSGGNGVYYHASYWGPDNESYMWINSMPQTMVYEELSKAYKSGIQKAWVLNAGDVQMNMAEIGFVMDLGYDIDQYNNENVFEQYYGKVAAREYGEEFADEVVAIMKEYTQMTNVRKLEHMSVDLFSAAYGDEMERRASQYKDLWERAEALYEAIPERQQNVFYETILFEVRCAYFINAEFYYAQKGNVAYEQGRNATAWNCYNHSLEFNRMRKDEISYYNTLLNGGKWENMMDPENYAPPVMSGFANGGPTFALGATEPGVIAEGESLEQQDSSLSFYNYAKGRKYIDIFNKGSGNFNYTVSADKDFVKLSSAQGVVTDEVRVWAEIDWSKISKNETATVTITSGNYTKTISINVVFGNYDLGEGTYVEQDGYVSIEAEHYTREKETAAASWEVIKDLGRVSGDMVRAESNTLAGYNLDTFASSAPYLEYDVYFTSTGTFEMEVYRLPTLHSQGHVRLAVGVGDAAPVVIEGERDYGTNNPAWEEGVFTQIIKHTLSITIENAGVNTIRLYMIDPWIVVDKMVVYTSEKQDSYFGPLESYNTTYNTDPAAKAYYDAFYGTDGETYTLPEGYDLAETYGTGYFVEQGGKLTIEPELAAEESEYAYTDGRWIPAVTDAGISMRTVDLREDYSGNTGAAPTMNFEIIITTPGTYNFWVNVQAPTHRSGAYAVGINGSEIFTQDEYAYDREEVFQWRKAGKALSFSAAGRYTLNIYCIEDGVSIEKIYLTKTSETPTSDSVTASARTTIYSSSDSAATAADAALRSELMAAASALGNYYAIPAGDGLGEYQQADVDALREAIEDVYALVNKTTALTEGETNAAIEALNAAYAAMNAGRNMSADGKNYLVYEDYEKSVAGMQAYGVEINALSLTPDMIVRRAADGTQYLNVRTFQAQRNMQKAFLQYSFAPQSGEVTVEARMSFNEADWGNAIYLLNEDGEYSVSIAFEYAYGKYNLVAYNAGVKTVLAEYTRNEMVDIKVVTDVESGRFDVYVNGEMKADGFRYRNSADTLNAVMFGSSAKNSDLRVDSIAVYTAE